MSAEADRRGSDSSPRTPTLASRGHEPPERSSVADVEWVRPLGKGEWYNWLIDKGNCTNFTVAAEVVGPVDWSHFQKTLAAAHARHPILGTRVRLRGHRAHFAIDSRQPPELQMELREDADPDSWRPLAESEMDRPIDVVAEPPVRTTVIRHGPDHATILMTFAHVVADGRSAALLLLETLRLATTGTAPPPPRAMVAAMESAFPAAHRGLRGGIECARFLGRLGVDLLRWGIPKQIAWMKPDPEHVRRTALLQLCLDPEAASGLMTRCRAESTTVQGALMAAILRAHQETFPQDSGDSLAIASAVDVRRYLQPPRTEKDLGYHIAIPMTVARMSRHPDFWDLARTCRERLIHSIDRGDLFQFWNLFLPRWLTPPDRRGALRVLGNIATTPQTISLSNIGNMGDGAISPEVRVRALHNAIGTTAHVPMVHVVTTMAGRIFVNCTTNSARMPDGAAERYLAHLESELLRAATPPPSDIRSVYAGAPGGG